MADFFHFSVATVRKSMSFDNREPITLRRVMVDRPKQHRLHWRDRLKAQALALAKERSSDCDRAAMVDALASIHDRQQPLDELGIEVVPERCKRRNATPRALLFYKGGFLLATWRPAKQELTIGTRKPTVATIDDVIRELKGCL